MSLIPNYKLPNYSFSLHSDHLLESFISLTSQYPDMIVGQIIGDELNCKLNMFSLQLESIDSRYSLDLSQCTSNIHLFQGSIVAIEGTLTDNKLIVSQIFYPTMPSMPVSLGSHLKSIYQDRQGTQQLYVAAGPYTNSYDIQFLEFDVLFPFNLESCKRNF